MNPIRQTMSKVLTVSEVVIKDSVLPWEEVVKGNVEREAAQMGFMLISDLRFDRVPELADIDTLNMRRTYAISGEFVYVSPTVH